MRMRDGKATDREKLFFNSPSPFSTIFSQLSHLLNPTNTLFSLSLSLYTLHSVRITHYTYMETEKL